jgi:hypothetical protein
LLYLFVGGIVRLHGGNNIKGLIVVGILSLVAPTLKAASVQLSTENGQKAKNYLAQKLENLSNMIDLKEKSYQEKAGKPINPGEINHGDGNTSLSNTTYHSDVWHYCLGWIGQLCQQWLDPYVALHGASAADRSPLEAVVYNDWQNSSRTPQGSGDGASYSIWNFKKQGGSLLDGDGKLDLEGVTDWRLKENTKTKVERLGYETALRQMGMSYEKNEAKDPQVMPNMESLRLMAGTYTKMMRNRMLGIIGQVRAAQPGIEFTQSEEVENCDRYLAEERRNQDQSRMEERIDPQPLLDQETGRRSLQERYELCKKAEKFSAYAVNPTVSGTDLRPGSSDRERVDSWRARVNLAAIDYGGIDLNQVPKPRNVTLTREDQSSVLGNWDVGGRSMKAVAATNGEVIQSYDDLLDGAAIGYQQAAARSKFIRDRSKDVQANKIGIGQMNLVKLNDLTPDQRMYAGEGGYKFSDKGGAPHPGDRLETKPAELVTTRVGH